MVSFFLFYILGIESSFFLVPILFLLLCLFFYTLYTVPFLSLFSLLLPLFSSMLPGIGCTTCFLLASQEEILILGFYEFRLPCLHTPLQSIYITTTSFVNHPLSSRSASSGGMLFSLQYSCAFSYIEHAGLLSCCAFCGLTIYIVFSLLFFSFFATMFGHSYL